MTIIEGIVVGTGGKTRRQWMNVEQDDGIRYWGTIPAALPPRDLVGRRVRVQVSFITEDIEWHNPRYGEFVAAKETA